MRTASAITSPPSTSHKVPDVKPEKITSGLAICSNTASAKKINADSASGSAPVAHNPITSISSAPVCITLTDTPGGGGVKKIATATTTINATSSARGFGITIRKLLLRLKSQTSNNRLSY